MGGVAAGLLVEALLRRSPRSLGVGWSRVGAEDEDRLRTGEEDGVAVEGVLRFAGELERLQLGRDREGEEAEQYPSQRRQSDPFQRLANPGPLRPGAPPWLVPLALVAFFRQVGAISQTGEIGLPQAG